MQQPDSRAASRAATSDDHAERSRDDIGNAGKATTLAVVGACAICCAPLLIAAPPLAVAGGLAMAGAAVGRALHGRRRRASRSADVSPAPDARPVA